MTLEQCYEQLKGNYQEAKQRLMTERLIAKFILKFPADPSMEQLRTAIKMDDHDAAFRAAHTLKGVAANLAFSDLQKNASELTEQLRSSQEAASQELLEKLEASYNNTINAINTYQSACE